MLPFSAWAQLDIAYPTTRLIIQRGTDNKASLFIAGTYSLPIDRIEARLVPFAANTGSATDWQTITTSPQNGVFQGTLRASGGLYRLEVRGTRQQQVMAQSTIERVGIGEVFLVAGQSNAMGLPDLGSKGASERVLSINATNTFLNSDNVMVSADKPFAPPVLSPLRATNLVFPMGESAWCWGDLGDAIADRYGVPVAFFNVGFPGTVADNWSRTAHGQTATNIFTSKSWPYLQPYANLRNTLQYYHSQLGIRAVLWHHGESDAVPYQTPLNEYRRLVQDLIDQSRQDFGQSMPWVVARCSITPSGPISSTTILGAQNALIQTPGNNVWPGPDTDSIQTPRPAHGHFENIAGGEQGLTEFGLSWHRSMTDQFYNSAKPIQPQRFLRIGLLPSHIPVGKEILVPYEQIGYPNKPDVNVQLLDQNGTFVMNVSPLTGGNSLRITLADTLRSGLYQLRVVAKSPVLPSPPSALFRVVGAGQPLNPLRDVQAETDGTTVRIHWQSAQEQPGSRFVIERQEGRDTFVEVGSLAPLNDGQPYHLYSFSYSKTSAANSTYRIRLDLPNGTSVYNPAAFITGTDEPTVAPLIYPNPNDGKNLSLQLPESGRWLLTLLDVTGRRICEQYVSATANVAVSVPVEATLPDGVYLVRLTYQNRVHTQRLVVVH
ncbi:hypothetical protein GCM10027592_09970 [Spirosoma flavus]